MKLDGSSFEVRAALSLVFAIPPVRLQRQGGNGGGMTGCHPTARPSQFLAWGKPVVSEVCGVTTNHHFFPGQRPCAALFERQTGFAWSSLEHI